MEAVLIEAGVPQSRAKVCSEIANGSWRKALRFSEEPIWKSRKTLLQFLRQPQSELAGLVDWAAKDQTHLQFLLDQMEFLTSEFIAWSVTPGQYVWKNQDAAVDLGQYVQKAERRFSGRPHARAFWFERSNALTDARSKLLAPLNKKLLVQNLLIPWLET